MLPDQEILKSLPPVRDDEPSSLRQDIVDEILDHLKCGLRRELLIRGGDEVTAKQRVLQKFGNPIQIARKLWFQAMWSKIMTQRLVVGSAVVSMFVSITLVGMVGWMMHRQNEANAALIEQIAKLVPQRIESPPQRDLHLNNLKIRVTTDSKDGPPAVGFGIVVSKFAGIGEITTNAGSHSATIGNDGFEDCGYVDQGRYNVIVNTPWGETSNTPFTISPGQDHVEHIVAPSKIPESVRVSIIVDGMSSETAAISLDEHGSAQTLSPQEAPTGSHSNPVSDVPVVVSDANALNPAASTGEATHAQGIVFINFFPTGARKIDDHLWECSWWNNGNIPASPWRNEIPMPVLIIVPSHGIWSRKIPKLTRPSIDTLSANVTQWERLSNTHEWKLPAHEYGVIFLLYYVNEDVTPDDPKWQQSVKSFGGSMQGGPMSGYSNLPKVIADERELNEWKITLPDYVKKYLRDPVPATMGGMGGGFF